MFAHSAIRGLARNGPGQIVGPARFANNNSSRKVIIAFISAYEVPANAGSACGPEPRSGRRHTRRLVYERPLSELTTQTGRMTTMARAQDNGLDRHGHEAQAQPEPPA